MPRRLPAPLRRPERRGWPRTRCTATRRCAGSTGRCCSRSRRSASSASRWSGRRPGRRRSTPAATRTASSSGTSLNTGDRPGARRRRASVFDYRMLRAYAPILYVASHRRPGRGADAARLDHQRRALLDRAGGGFSVQPSEFAKVALVVGHGDAARGEARRRGRARATRRPARARCSPPCRMALVMLQPDLGTAMVISASSCSACSPSSGAPNRWVLGLVVAGRRAGASARSSSACSRTTRSTASPPSPTRAPTRRGAGYNANQARIAIGSGGLDRHGPVPRRADQRPVRPRAADRLHLHRRGGGARASSAPRLIIAAARRRAVAGLRIASRADRPVRPAGRRRHPRAGSPSRPSRTSG